MTGAARGQGRSHAVRLAREGADVIALDLCGQIATVPYPMGTPADLAETVRQVDAQGRTVVAARADVRDAAAVQRAVDDGVARLGRLDVVVANAGVTSYASAAEITDEMWDDVVGTCLSGVFRTARAAIGHLKAHGDGGAVVLTSSSEGLIASEHMAHYTAAEHGVVGLTKVLALELAPRARCKVGPEELVGRLVVDHAGLAGQRRGPLRHRRPAAGRHRRHHHLALRPGGADLRRGPDRPEALRPGAARYPPAGRNSHGTARWKGRLRDRSGARSGPQPRRPDGAGGGRRHRRRPVQRGQHRALRPGDARRPGRDGAAGRGAGPADRRHPGRRP